ncbi:MAG: hypothetical protein ACREQB_07385, partial [Candidatus Binataceae bacterium]
MRRKLCVGWLVQSNDFNLASVRYRCHHMAAGLRAHGVESRVTGDPNALARALDEFDAVVIVKRLDEGARKLAIDTRSRRKAVILDLCDDIISGRYRPDGSPGNLAALGAMAPFLSCVVATGPMLAARLKQVLPSGVPVC